MLQELCHLTSSWCSWTWCVTATLMIESPGCSSCTTQTEMALSVGTKCSGSRRQSWAWWPWRRIHIKFITGPSKLKYKSNIFFLTVKWRQCSLEWIQTKMVLSLYRSFLPTAKLIRSSSDHFLCSHTNEFNFLLFWMD